MNDEPKNKTAMRLPQLNKRNRIARRHRGPSELVIMARQVQAEAAERRAAIEAQRAAARKEAA